MVLLHVLRCQANSIGLNSMTMLFCYSSDIQQAESQVCTNSLLKTRCVRLPSAWLNPTRLHGQVVSVASSFAEVWEGVGGLLAELDLLAGFAALGTSAPIPYVRPTMLPPEAGELVLEGCRCVPIPSAMLLPEQSIRCNRTAYYRCMLRSMVEP